MKEERSKKKKKGMNKSKDMNISLKYNLNYIDTLHNAYPYLSLLEGICTCIKTSLIDNDETYSSSNADSHFKLAPMDIPHLDNKLYPYASLLQNLIYESNLNNIDELVGNQKHYGELHSIMRNLCYPFEYSPPEQFDQSILEKYDFTYASKLKLMACQSESSGCSENTKFHNHYLPEMNELKYILRSMFPDTGGETQEFSYSDKLKQISEQVRNEEEKMDIDTHFPYSYENSSQHWKRENFTDCIRESNPKNGTSIPSSGIKDFQNNCIDFENKEYTFTSQLRRNNEQSERFLFEALMKNVQLQANQNCSHDFNERLKEESSVTIKQEVVVEEFNPTLFGEAGIKVIERRLMKHLKNIDDT